MRPPVRMRFAALDQIFQVEMLPERFRVDLEKDHLTPRSALGAESKVTPVFGGRKHGENKSLREERQVEIDLHGEE
jgi:hypothetical protein